MALEAKHDDERYILYWDAIQDGLDKLKKYYSCFNQKPTFILALSKQHHLQLISEWLMMEIIVLHPYYQLAYIKLAWGGEEEQVKEWAAGNRYAKNWQDKARKVIEAEVQYIISFGFYGLTSFRWKSIGGIAPNQCQLLLRTLQLPMTWTMGQLLLLSCPISIDITKLWWLLRTMKAGRQSFGSI